MTRLASIASLFFTFTLAACVTEPDVAPPDLSNDPAVPPTGGTVDVPPDPHVTVRDVTVSCQLDVQNRERVTAIATTDTKLVGRVAIELQRGTDVEGFELDFSAGKAMFTADGQFIGFSRTELVNVGNLILDASSPVTCASFGEFGIKVEAAFQSGFVGCAFAGDPTEAALMHCGE